MSQNKVLYISSKSINLLTFLFGFIGLSIQLLSGRNLSIYFGNSIYTWGSVIGIFMLYLSIGYYTGGVLSSKLNTQNRILLLRTLCYLLCISLLFISFLGNFLSAWFSQMTLPSHYSVIFPLLSIYGLPAFFIGVSTPIFIQLHSIKDKGNSSGFIFFIDTIGGLLGIFLTTFLIIPNFDYKLFTIILALLLVLLDVIIISNNKEKSFFIFCSIFVLTFGSSYLLNKQNTTQGLYLTVDSTYQQIQVIDKNNTRILYSDLQPQSAMNLNSPTFLEIPYTQYFPYITSLTKGNKVLFLGGGGYSGPRYYSSLGFDVTVVELDQEITNLAIKYFNVDPSQINIKTMDARVFLTKTDEKYDIIILDAFKKSYIPYHLATVEFMELIDNRLTSGGILITNILASPVKSNSKDLSYELFRKYINTVHTVFPSTFFFPVKAYSPVYQNIEIFTIKTPQSLSENYIQNKLIEPLPYTNFNKLYKAPELDNVFEPFTDNKSSISTYLK